MKMWVLRVLQAQNLSYQVRRLYYGGLPWKRLRQMWLFKTKGVFGYRLLLKIEN